MNFRSKVLYTALTASIACNAGGLVWYLRQRTSSLNIPTELTQSTQEQDQNISQYKFLSQRLFRENRNDIFINFVPLRQAMRDAVAKMTAKTSVYFEYLPSGSSIGINSTDEIPMASLVKIPTVMTIYDKMAQGKTRKDFLLRMRPQDIDQKYGTFWKEGVGARLSVEDAIKKTIVDSDNTTTRMLNALLTPDDILNMFNQLDINIVMENNKVIPYISAKSYSSILKSLYLSTFLEKDQSNEILNLLSQNESKEGLHGGVDDQIKVAHKTGVIERVDGTNIYNDCGIVYAPKRPYILCILVNGNEEEIAKKQIASLSTMVYGYIKAVNSGSALNIATSSATPSE